MQVIEFAISNDCCVLNVTLFSFLILRIGITPCVGLNSDANNCLGSLSRLGDLNCVLQSHDTALIVPDATPESGTTKS
jgi:hypothetical protein